MKGFTLTELLVVTGALVLLAALSLPTISSFQNNAEFGQEVISIISALEAARHRTLASEGAGTWGVAFSDLSSPNEYVLFQGASYTLRDTNFDKVYQLPEYIIFDDINLNSLDEIVFSRITGLANNPGFVRIALDDDLTVSQTIYVESSGLVSIAPSPVITDTRQKDSRHIHLDYDRVIDTNIESIVLNFEGGVTETIPIVSNMMGGQIDWTGQIDVGGEDQIIRIHTHRLNDIDTQFCIHRDLRYNNRILDIDIDGDFGISPNLVNYQADGTTTQGSSIFITDLLWQ